MRVYSAAEAIGPAWEHTVDLLWRPRRWGTLLKVSLVACFAQAGNTFSSNLPANISKQMGGHTSAALRSTMLGLVLFFGLIGLAISLVLLYVGARLQFVLFELVARRQTRVAPAWNYHGGRTWRWLGAKVPFLVAILFALLPITFALVRFQAQHPPDPLHPFAIFRALLPVFAEAVAIGTAIATLQMIFHDFGLPSMAIEDTSIGETYQRVWGLIGAEPGQVALYILLRLVVGFVAGLAAELVWAVAVLISALPLALIGFGLWLPLHHNSAGQVISFLVIGILVALLFAWAILLFLVAIGTVYFFYQAWALYFLGGRYPLLGNLLEPPIAVPVWTPPPSLPTDEGPGGGPDLPLNPAPV